MGDLGVQKMFEYYLYDYLLKNKMGETAEIFGREANLNFDLTRPPLVDTPDGFLHEWWGIFYDMFRSRMAANEERDDGSSLSRQHEMNGKLQNPAISADPGCTLQPIGAGGVTSVVQSTDISGLRDVP
eukprot:XP_019076027.1 PREDICTED: transcriptional corepressor LEUNIG_HOMOLOG-like [Vitis vinifera]